MNGLTHQILHGVARVANRVRGDISVVRRCNITWAVSKNNFVDRHIINGYYYEPDRLRRCIYYIKSYNINTLVDIGANIGLYSIHLAQHAKLEEIHAFEPVTQNFNQLCANIFLNNLNRRIIAHKFGISNEDGLRTIYVDSLSTGISKFQDWNPPLTKKTKDRDYYSEAIETKKLDSVLRWQGRRLLAKIDVEGHELEVLRGMTSLLAHNKLVLQIEIVPENEASVKRLLRDHAYFEMGQLGGDYYFSNFDKA
jgi:FkbM family methyltransferase